MRLDWGREALAIPLELTHLMGADGGMREGFLTCMTLDTGCPGAPTVAARVGVVVSGSRRDRSD